MYFQRDVDLLELAEMPGLSSHCAMYLAEAARVCLDSQGYPEHAHLAVSGDEVIHVPLSYECPDSVSRASHSDEIRATEDGACGIALLLCRLLKGHAFVEKAQQLEGVDYWVGETEEGRPFNRKARLEATGIREGDTGGVNARFGAKLKTTTKSSGTCEVIIAVIEFSQPMARMETRP